MGVEETQLHFKLLIVFNQYTKPLCERREMFNLSTAHVSALDITQYLIMNSTKVIQVNYPLTITLNPLLKTEEVRDSQTATGKKIISKHSLGLMCAMFIPNITQQREQCAKGILSEREAK